MRRICWWCWCERRDPYESFVVGCSFAFGLCRHWTLIADADEQRARTMMGYYVVNSLRGKPERIEKLCDASVG